MSIVLVGFQALALPSAPAFAWYDDDKIINLENRKFTRIEVTGVYDVEIRGGRDFDVRLNGKTAVLERATIKIENDTLYLGHQKGRKFRGSKTIEANISLPVLSSIGVSGVVDGVVSGIEADEFRVSVSGVADLDLRGKCDRLRAELSGVGDMDARHLKCNSVTISVSGVGDATVFAHESLDARVSGIGDLTCYGSPNKVRKSKNFFSSISVH